MKKNAFFVGLKDKICDLYKKNKKIFFACVACFVIMIALIVSTFADLSKPKSKANNDSGDKSISVTSYANDLEKKLTALISKLDSVSSVSVFVAIDSTPTITYLTEKTEKVETKDGSSVSEITTTVVYEKNGSVSTPVVVTTIMPKVTGVLIVTNKLNASTKHSIINSVSVVLNIDASCISLLQES